MLARRQPKLLVTMQEWDHVRVTSSGWLDREVQMLRQHHSVHEHEHALWGSDERGKAPVQKHTRLLNNLRLSLCSP